MNKSNISNNTALLFRSQQSTPVVVESGVNVEGSLEGKVFLFLLRQLRLAFHQVPLEITKDVMLGLQSRCQLLKYG